MDLNGKKHISNMLKYLIFKDKNFFSLITTYGIIVAILSLALPISVQVLINSVIYTALIPPVIIIGIVLLFLLSLSAVLGLLQKFLIEIYKRNSFVRLSSHILLKAIYSDYLSFGAHNTSDLSSRYFEIFNIQRNAADLIVEGFLVFLTILVSFLISSFYHPYFLALNIIVLLFIWLSLSLFSRRAIERAIYKSEAKFAVFAWLDDIFRMNTFFKSGKNKDYALSKGYSLIKNYIYGCKKYWNISFTQLIILTTLYVVLTILLLTLGSTLVIKGQLSLGQLVAAEILYASSLYGLSKLSTYYDMYYNLIASIDEMGHLFKIKEEEINKLTTVDVDYKNDEIIKFNQVSYTDYFGKKYQFNFAIMRNSCNLILTLNQNVKSIVVNLLTNLIQADKGFIEYESVHVNAINQHYLRNQIAVINNVNMFGCTIYEFLNFGISENKHAQINDVLEVVGLSNLIYRLDKGLDTVLVHDGYPLQEHHIILLKIAKAILSECRVIIITEIFDHIDKNIQQRLLNYIARDTNLTLICFSENENNHIHYDNFIFLTNKNTYMTKDSATFYQILNEKQYGDSTHEK